MQHLFKSFKKNAMNCLALTLLLLMSVYASGQNRHEKTIAIINKLNLVESQKTNYQFLLEPLKYITTGNDSITIIEIEKQLDEKEMIKRISSAFHDIFNDKEINDLYDFTESSVQDKLFISGDAFKDIYARFKDINQEIDKINKSLDENREEKTIKKFEPIPADKMDGFYRTLNYSPSMDYNDIILEENPSLTTNDILEVKKVYIKHYDNHPEISIVLTREGARKFYNLTKENIGEPLAIVIEKQIVSIPIINSEIMGGKVNISGDFSENEIDRMIKKLSKK